MTAKTRNAEESTSQIFHAIPSEQLKLLVFDLDGTLADTTVDLCNSVNAALRHFHLSPLPDPAIVSFVGDGTPMLMHRSLSLSSGIAIDQVDEELLAAQHSFFLDHYSQHELDNTALYPGVMDSLDELFTAAKVTDWSLAVLSNKPHRPSEEILAGLGIRDYFARIYGGDGFPARKPEPLGLLHLMREAGARPDETVMVGDSEIDVQIARRAGAWSLGCSFGFGASNLKSDPPDVLVTTPNEWAKLLCGSYIREAH